MKQETVNKTEQDVESELTISISENLNISGTLLIGSSNDLAIIVPGSGPTDRNGNSPLGITGNSYKLLAESLSNQSLSVFRYDKLGIGNSSRMSEEKITIESSARDLMYLVEYFHNTYKTIHLIGHSEGGLIANIAAIELGDSISSLSLLCSTSQSIDSLILEQLTPYPSLKAEAAKHFGSIKDNEPLTNVSKELIAIFRPSSVPFLKSSLSNNPTELVSKVSIPTFIIGGTCDIQTPAAHSERLAEYCQNCNLKIIPEMGHLLKTLNFDCSNAKDAYTNPTLTINDELIQILAQFINAN